MCNEKALTTYYFAVAVLVVLTAVIVVKLIVWSSPINIHDLDALTAELANLLGISLPL